MKSTFSFAIVIPLTVIFFAIISGAASAETIEANLRNRPPDLNLNNGKGSGPLKDILEIAASRIGAEVDWIEGPFKKGLEDLRSGRLDLVPRTFMREDRKAFLHYLRPIGFQEKSIVFFVNKGKESILSSYDDLYKLKVGVKRGTVFYPKFDKDSNIKKVEGTEDASLAKMLIHGRFDVVISIDQKGMEQEFKKIGFSDYSLADYRHAKRIGLYYATSKKRYESGKKSIYDALDSELQKMVKSGEIDKIYQTNNAPPPLH